MLVQAESGLIAITGTPETPVKTGIPTADIASGMYCFSGRTRSAPATVADR